MGTSSVVALCPFEREVILCRPALSSSPPDQTEWTTLVRSSSTPKSGRRKWGVWGGLLRRGEPVPPPPCARGVAQGVPDPKPFIWLPLRRRPPPPVPRPCAGGGPPPRPPRGTRAPRFLRPLEKLGEQFVERLLVVLRVAEPLEAREHLDVSAERRPGGEDLADDPGLLIAQALRRPDVIGTLRPSVRQARDGLADGDFKEAEVRDDPADRGAEVVRQDRPDAHFPLPPLSSPDKATTLSRNAWPRYSQPPANPARRNPVTTGGQ